MEIEDMRIMAIMGLLLLASAAGAREPNYKWAQRQTDTVKRAMFANAVRSVGESCTGVKKYFFRGADQSGAGYWAIRCADDRTWSVSIADDDGGTATVLSCTMFETVTKFSCWEPLGK